MPRKQRFKPSRKPKPPVQPQTSGDDRREVHPDDVEVETEAPARGGPSSEGVTVENEGGGATD